MDEAGAQLVIWRRDATEWSFDAASIALEPSLDDVARWASRGLSAYDAGYAALAEETDSRLLTHDADLLALLPDRAISAFSR